MTFFAVNGLHLLNLTIQYLPKPAKIIIIILHPTQISVQNAAWNLKIQKGWKSISLQNIYESKTDQPPLDSGLFHSDTRCSTCKQGLFTTSITSSSNGKTLNIKQPVTCKTKNVCYLINCRKCSQQYIGETKLQFHVRMNNHTSDIRTNKKSTGMVRHFTNCGVNNIRPVILERVRTSDPFIRKAR